MVSYYALYLKSLIPCFELLIDPYKFNDFILMSLLTLYMISNHFL